MPMFSPSWQKLLLRIRGHGGCKGPPRKQASRACDADHAPGEERSLGCGWFDSSHDLQHGLQVQEADPLTLAQLSLAVWLALQEPRRSELAPASAFSTGIITHPNVH